MEDQLGSPPLTRGIPNQAQKSYVGSRITPAYAGNTPDEHVEGMATEDHPRLRGEYLKIAITQLTDKGSPPLTRGIQDRIALIADPCGITPAYAGNTAAVTPLAVPPWGSPPLTRGILAVLLAVNFRIRITPAYAGNTYNLWCLRAKGKDHPRLRGEYSRYQCGHSTFPGSPPLTRGIPNQLKVADGTTGITPAYAGNTLKESLIYSIFPLSATKFHLVSHTLEMS